MLGYWRQEELTKKAISNDGWMRTGDGAKMDEDGYVFIVDRVKDMIISRENIYSMKQKIYLPTFRYFRVCSNRYT